jgi:hypothetical protein
MSNEPTEPAAEPSATEARREAVRVAYMIEGSLPPALMHRTANTDVQTWTPEDHADFMRYQHDVSVATGDRVIRNAERFTFWLRTGIPPERLGPYLLSGTDNGIVHDALTAADPELAALAQAEKDALEAAELARAVAGSDEAQAHHDLCLKIAGEAGTAFSAAWQTAICRLIGDKPA